MTLRYFTTISIKVEMEHIRPPVRSDPIPIVCKPNAQILAPLPERQKGHPLNLKQWSTERRSVSLKSVSTLHKALTCIRDVLRKEHPMDVMGSHHEFEIELVDDASNHADKSLNFNALNGTCFDLTERERWCVIKEGAILAFKLGRYPGHEEPLYVIVAYFNWRDALTIEECRHIIEHKCQLRLDYPYMNSKMRTKWENIGKITLP